MCNFLCVCVFFAKTAYEFRSFLCFLSLSLSLGRKEKFYFFLKREKRNLKEISIISCFLGTAFFFFAIFLISPLHLRKANIHFRIEVMRKFKQCFKLLGFGNKLETEICCNIESFDQFLTI